MAKRSIHQKWFSSMVDPSLSSVACSGNLSGEKYVKHDQGYPNLHNDLLSLKLDDRWATMNIEHVRQWITPEAFKEKYRDVFDEDNLNTGLTIMMFAAIQSNAIIFTNNKELPFQLYSRLIGHTTEYEVVKQYLSSLVKLKSMVLLPLEAYWPSPNSSEIIAHYHSSPLCAVCFLHDNDTIVFADSEDVVNVFSLQKGYVTTKLSRHSNSVTSVSVSQDGRWIVSGSDDRTVRLWDLNSNFRSSKILKGHTSTVNSVSISGDGRFVVSGSDDYTVRLWDSHDETPISKVLEGHCGSVSAVSINGDGRWIVSGSLDHTVRLWDTRAHVITDRLLDFNHRIDYSGLIAAGGRWIATGSNNNNIKLWDSEVGFSRPKVLRGHLDVINHISISRDGRWIISASDDDTIRLWDTHSDIVSSKIILKHSIRVTGMSISGNNQWIVTGCGDHTVRLYNLHNHVVSCNKSQQYSTAQSSRISLHENRRYIMLQSEEHTLTVWDSHSDIIVPKVLQGHAKKVNSVSISGDGRWIVSGSDDYTVRLWDSHALTITSKVMPGYTDEISSVSISEDGTWIVSANRDNNDIVQIWDRRSCHLKYVFFTEEEVRSVEFKSSNMLTMHFQTTSVDLQIIEDDMCESNQMLETFTANSVTNFSSHALIQVFKFANSISSGRPHDPDQQSSPPNLQHVSPPSSSVATSSSVSSSIKSVEMSSKKTPNKSWNMSTQRSRLSSQRETGSSMYSDISSTSGMTNAMHSGHRMGVPLWSTSNLAVGDIVGNAISKQIFDFFHNFNTPNAMYTSDEDEKKPSVGSEKLSPSSDSSVEVFCVKNGDHNEKSLQTLFSEKFLPAMTRMPFYCDWNCIYHMHSKTPIARLPLPVKTWPNDQNSVIYNVERQTLIVFLDNNTPCFYRLNKKQDELRVDEFMDLRSDMFGTSLSILDISLFNYFKQSSSKIRMMNSCTALDHFCDGIFLGLTSQKNIPVRESRLDFRFALHKNGDGHEMIVMVDPFVLTPLGLSILFWLLPITPYNHRILKSLMKHMRLSNCFSTKVTGEKGTSKETALVIPEGWALEYKIDDNFIVEHSILGGFGICIGMQGSSQWSALPRTPTTLISTGRYRVGDSVESTTTQVNYHNKPRECDLRQGLLSWVRKSKTLAVLEIIPRDSDNDGDDDDQDYGRLEYRELGEQPKWIFKKLHVNVNIPFVEAGFEVGPSEINIGLTSLGQAQQIRSLNKFVMMDMIAPHENLYNRMKWFEKVLSKIGSFPVGEKRGFLEQFAYEIKDGDEINIFRCCSVRPGSLSRRECKQQGAEDVRVFIPMPKGSDSEFLAFSGTSEFIDGRNVLRVDKKMKERKMKEKLEMVTYELW